MANWQDDPDLAAMRPRRRTPWGRIFMGVVLVGCGTFGFGYYLPLYRAHHALTDDHAKLREKLETVEQTLSKTEADLKSASSKRDELLAQEADREAKVSSRTSELNGLRDALVDAAEKSVKGKGAVAGVDATGAHLALPASQLLLSSKLEVTSHGTALLCSVAKAVGDKPLHVLTVAKDDDVPAPLKSKFDSAWDYAAAASAAVATTLETKCKLTGSHLYVEASDGSRPAPAAFGGHAPSPRVELSVLADKH